MPAPQALIRTTRPERLNSAPGKVLGIESGSIRDHVQYIAHTLHNVSRLPDYTVRCEAITVNSSNPIKAKTWAPLTFLSILGCAMSVAILVTSIVKEDGMALLAILLLSFLSTLIGIGSRWSLESKERTATRQVPRSDVVIQYPQGAFLIVRCKGDAENTARQLYWHPPECRYKVEDVTYRIISLVGTLMLMFGVICLGNATLTLQICFAGAYLILNAAYWAVAALPQQWHWDLSHFTVERVHYTGDGECETFTEALWKAIAISGSVKWVRPGKVAPVSDAWVRWLAEAEQVLDNRAKNGYGQDGTSEYPYNLPEWDPERAMDKAQDEARSHAHSGFQ